MKQKVLVIEDEVNLLKAIKAKLTFLGFEIITAENGREGLVALEQKPDLIWLDLYLPQMDGIDFLKEMKKRPTYADIPIIIATVSRGKADVAVAIEGLPIVSYFIKSDVTLDTIADKVKEVLSRKT